MDAAMRIFEVTRRFPAEERFAMTDQMRRSSRAVCAAIGEAWRKRNYRAHFVSKLTDATSESEETRVWLEFARRCKYLDESQFNELDDVYDKIIGQLTLMLARPGNWVIR